MHLAFLSQGALPLLLAGSGIYIGWKYLNRRRFVRNLRIARITPEELHQRVSAGEDVFILDLRAMESQADSETIPGAVQMDSSELGKLMEIIPRDREVVLFCDCPNEASAAHMALRLRARGVARIRPLAGGFAGWRNGGFPISCAFTRVEKNDSLVGAQSSAAKCRRAMLIS
jgi:rhodanese-related sulfurtransferase